MPKIIQTRYFMEEHGYIIEVGYTYQDNQSDIHLETNSMKYTEKITTYQDKMFLRH